MPNNRAPEQKIEQPSLIPSDVVVGLLTALAVVSDPRKDRGKRHQLRDVLAMAVLGCLCGCDDAEALQDWSEKERSWLSCFLDLPHGTPSQDVFLRLLAAIDPSQFRLAFLAWVRELLGVFGIHDQIAVDGQTSRGSRDRAKKQNPVHMVSALVCGDGIVIGQVRTDEKSNEITAIPQLLSLLDLRGSLVSMDAMGCQVSIAKLIVGRGGDYLIGLKGNQSSLRDEAALAFEAAASDINANVDECNPPEVQSATEVDKGHGRIETRTAKVMTDFGSWVPASKRWTNLVCLIAIESTRETIVTGAASTETRYYISSRVMSPEQALVGVRNHWLVENQLHWCLDVSFGQDANQTRTKNAAENLAVVRHFAVNIIRNYNGDRYSVPRRRRLCDYDRDYRSKLLGLSSRQ